MAIAQDQDVRGDLSVLGNYDGPGSVENRDGDLHVKGKVQVGLNTGHEDADNFLAFSGGVPNETAAYIAWQQGPLRIGTATDFNTFATEALRIMDSGNIGIGTPTPQNKLDVSGGLSVGTSYAGTQTTPTDGLLVEGDVGIGTVSPLAKLQVTGGAIMPAAGNSDQAGIMFPKDPGGGSGDAAWIRYYPRTGEATTLEIGTSNDSNDHIALMPSGKVGIGTPNPGAKLEVAGDIKVTGNMRTDGALQVGSSGSTLSVSKDGNFSYRTDVLFANTAGNVGIGTTNLGAKLEVAGDIRTNVALISDNPHGAIYAAFSHRNQGTAGGYALLQHKDGETYLNTPTGKNINFRVNNSTKMRLMSNGYVGINDTTPSYQLDVNGTARVTSLRIGSKTAEQYFDGRYIRRSSSYFRVTSGELSTRSRYSSAGWRGYADFNRNYVDIYPPSGFTMSHLLGFVASSSVIAFRGDVNGDDYMWCRRKLYSNKIRVICANSENRNLAGYSDCASFINYLAIWRK